MQWNNLNEPVSVDDNITFGQILLMFVVDSVLYILIMWYVEAVFPGQYGIPQRPWFFVLVSVAFFPYFLYIHHYVSFTIVLRSTCR